MELLFESREELTGMSGHLTFFQRQPEIHPTYVLTPDRPTDEQGLSHYGTVLADGDKLRMWYMAVGRNFPPHTLGGSAAVAYAESTDGLSWTKPDLGLVDTGTPNNLTDLGLHSGTVFIDPTAPDSHRYRAVGCGRDLYHRVNPAVTTNGYYTAHSADGFRWTLDSSTPRWNWIDVVTSIWHPGRQTGMVALKVTPTVHRIARRSIHTSVMRDGHYSDHLPALYADEYDDMCAVRHGFNTCDYYGMGMLPAGKQGVVGFLWKFWHQLPYSEGWGNGPQALYGRSDISLTYQPTEGSRWFHVPGRPDFIARQDLPMDSRWVYTGSTPVLVGDQHRLYFTSRPRPHGYGRNITWGPDERHQNTFGNSGVTFASWPKWRLFGFEAIPSATLTIKLGELPSRCTIRLNYETIDNTGSIRATLAGNGFDDRHPSETDILTGEGLETTLTWNGDSLVQPTTHANLKLELDHARVYAYQVIPQA